MQCAITAPGAFSAPVHLRVLTLSRGKTCIIIIAGLVIKNGRPLIGEATARAADVWKLAFSQTKRAVLDAGS